MATYVVIWFTCLLACCLSAPTNDKHSEVATFKDPPCFNQTIPACVNATSDDFKKELCPLLNYYVRQYCNRTRVPFSFADKTNLANLTAQNLCQQIDWKLVKNFLHWDIKVASVLDGKQCTPFCSRARELCITLIIITKKLNNTGPANLKPVDSPKDNTGPANLKPLDSPKDNTGPANLKPVDSPKDNTGPANLKPVDSPKDNTGPANLKPVDSSKDNTGSANLKPVDSSRVNTGSANLKPVDTSQDNTGPANLKPVDSSKVNTGSANLKPVDSSQDNTGPANLKPVDSPKDPKRLNSKQQKEYIEAPSSAHFMGYFLTAIVLCITGYVLFHNKQKIIAFIIEGRHRKRGRRPNSGEYRKLQTNVDDVMHSLDKSTSSQNYIY